MLHECGRYFVPVFRKMSNSIHFLRGIYELAMTRKFVVAVVEKPNSRAEQSAMLE